MHQFCPFSASIANCFVVASSGIPVPGECANGLASHPSAVKTDHDTQQQLSDETNRFAGGVMVPSNEQTTIKTHAAATIALVRLGQWFLTFLPILTPLSFR